MIREKFSSFSLTLLTVDESSHIDTSHFPLNDCFNIELSVSANHSLELYTGIITLCGVIVDKIRNDDDHSTYHINHCADR